MLLFTIWYQLVGSKWLLFKQIATWIMIPTNNGLAFSYALTVLKTFVFLQFVPRAIRIYPLTSNIFTDASIVRALFNLLLYVLISHVFGAYWYFLSVERNTVCWKRACANQTQCNPSSSSFYCNDSGEDRTFLNDLCQSKTIKSEEIRLEAQEMLKQWRLFSELPENLKLEVKIQLWDVMRKTKVVDLETLLNDLPRDLRTDIKRQLWEKVTSVEKNSLLGLKISQIRRSSPYQQVLFKQLKKSKPLL